MCCPNRTVPSIFFLWARKALKTPGKETPGKEGPEDEHIASLDALGFDWEFMHGKKQKSRNKRCGETLEDQADTVRLTDGRAGFCSSFILFFDGDTRSLKAPKNAVEANSPCPDIGAGWAQEVVPRKKRSACARMADRYFFSPEGKKFRSMAEVHRHLRRNDGLWNESQKNQDDVAGTPCAEDALPKSSLIDVIMHRRRLLTYMTESRISAERRITEAPQGTRKEFNGKRQARKARATQDGTVSARNDMDRGKEVNSPDSQRPTVLGGTPRKMRSNAGSAKNR